MAIQTYRFLNEEGVNKLLSDLRSKIDEMYSKVGHTHTPAEAGADPAGSAAQALLDAKAYTKEHTDLKNNPHEVTAAQVGAPTIAEAQGMVDALANDAVKKNTDAIAKLTTEGGEGSISKAITDAVSDAQETLQGNIDDLEDRIEEVEGDIGNLEDLDTTAKGDLVNALNEVRNAVSAGGVAAAITIETETTTSGMLKSYTIKQGENTVGTIDIPKDMVVISGEVVTNPEGKAEGTYIKLVLANVAEPLYINVGTLVDIYKAKASAAQVQVAIDSATREISATIVAGSIGTTELADDAVTTAKIADGNITKAKLSTAVQGSLDKADTAAPQSALDNEIDRATKAEAKALADAKEYVEQQITNNNTTLNLGGVATDLSTHVNDKTNPHEVTAEQVGADPVGSAAAALAEAKEYTDTVHKVIILEDITTNAKFKLYVNEGTLVIEEQAAAE